jgi:hypothetical protein
MKSKLSKAALGESAAARPDVEQEKRIKQLSGRWAALISDRDLKNVLGSELWASALSARELVAQVEAEAGGETPPLVGQASTISGARDACGSFAGPGGQLRRKLTAIVAWPGGCGRHHGLVINGKRVLRHEDVLPVRQRRFKVSRRKDGARWTHIPITFGSRT